MNSLTVRYDLVHLLQTIIDHILERHLFVATDQIFRLDVTINQNTSHLAVLVLYLLWCKHLLYQHHRLKAQLKILTPKALYPDILANVHVPSYNKVSWHSADYFLSLLANQRKMFEWNFSLFEDNLKEYNKSCVYFLFKFLYPVDLWASVLFNNGHNLSEPVFFWKGRRAFGL